MGCKCANKSEDEEKDEEILKKALEDGLVTFLTDGINEGDIGEAVRNFAINYLKTMQKFFAQEMVTDMMTKWFPARRKELMGFDEFAKATDYEKMFNNSEVNSQYMQDEANFTIARGMQKVQVVTSEDIGKAIDTDSVKEAVEDTKKSVDKQAEKAEDVANEMAKARAKDNELQVKPMAYQQMPNAPVNYNLQSKMVSGMGNYKFIHS